MNANQFLRGFIIVICAQIPLMALFIYLLFSGVGISDFSKLAVEPPDYEAVLEQRNEKLLRQMNTVIGQVNLKITNLQTQIEKVASSRQGASETSSSQDTFVASGGPQKIEDLFHQLEMLSEQLVATRTDVTALSDQLSATKSDVTVLIEQGASSQTRVDERSRMLEQEIAQLRSALSGQGDQLENIGNQTRELMAKEYPVLHAEAPKREPVAELRFGVDAWAVSHKAEWSLEKVIQEAKRQGRNASISIYGFMAQKGPLNFSMALADKRARAVAEVLRLKGIKSNPITIFVVPEYSAYRSSARKTPGDKNNAVHIYVETP